MVGGLHFDVSLLGFMGFLGDRIEALERWLAPAGLGFGWTDSGLIDCANDDTLVTRLLLYCFSLCAALAEDVRREVGWRVAAAAAVAGMPEGERAESRMGGTRILRRSTRNFSKRFTRVDVAGSGTQPRARDASVRPPGRIVYSRVVLQSPTGYTSRAPLV